MPTPLVIGSCEPFSGKSSVLLGLARHLSGMGCSLTLGKPLATCIDGFQDLPPGSPLIDADVRFMGETLGLPEERLIPSLEVVEAGSAQRRLTLGDFSPGDDFASLRRRIETDDDEVILLEAPGSLHEGMLYGLSVVQLAKAFQAPVLLVQPWQDCTSVDPLLEARERLGDLLAGVVLNMVDPEGLASLQREVEPALEGMDLPILGVIPRSPLLRSVSVSDLAQRLQAEVLCCSERLDLMVETLSIGAMNVNAAMEFFRRRRNMAVVTGADRTDIQLAALEASTQCLILTGVGEPLPQLISRAEELEVPVLKVEHDTLTTVEVVDAAIGHGRLHESLKAGHATRHVIEHCRFDRLLERLRLPLPT